MDMKTSKSNIIRGKLERYKDNPKKFWYEINKLLPHSNESPMTNIQDEDTDHIFYGIELNDHINSYFSSIGSKLANECTPGVIRNDLIMDLDNIKNFDRAPFTEEEVLKVCKGINICDLPPPNEA